MLHISQILKKNSYSTKLQSAQWTQFSQGVRKTRNSCEVCRRRDVSLQVHHLFYDPAREPWEYEGADIVVLCTGCHKQIHEQLNLFRRFVFGKMNPRAFQVLNGALAVAFDKYDPLVFCHALAEFVSQPTMVQRYADAWGLSAAPKSDPNYDPESQTNKTRTALSGL